VVEILLVVFGWEHENEGDDGDSEEPRRWVFCRPCEIHDDEVLNGNGVKIGSWVYVGCWKVGGGCQ